MDTEAVKDTKLRIGNFVLEDRADMKRFFEGFDDVMEGNTTEDILRRFLVYERRIFRTSKDRDQAQEDRGTLVTRVMEMEQRLKIYERRDKEKKQAGEVWVDELMQHRGPEKKHD